MKTFPFISLSTAVVVLRVITAILLIMHGIERIKLGTVDNFGGFLDSKGFMIGVPLAWAITIFELVGGLLMAIGIARQWIALGFIVELLAGIILVHAANGWFVVGASSGGVEYSILLIFSLIVIAASRKK